MSEAQVSEDLVDLYETAPCGYVSLLPDGRICKLNRTLALWLGRDADELIGEPVHELLGFGGRIAFETHMAPLLRMQGYVYELALDLVAADGTRIPAIANAAEKRDREGNHLFTRLTLFKAVDRRTYERSLLEARVKAEADAESERAVSLVRDQFIAVLGHDLRNPLAALASGIDMLAREDRLSDRGRKILAEMRGSAERAMELIEDVLDLARGRLGGGISVARRPAPLSEALEQIVAEMRAIAPDRAIKARIEVADPVYCDPGRLLQLASNLLSNAVTHGAEGEPVLFDARTSDEEFVLSVANAGKPIPDKVREQLFEPFFRGAARSSRNGLGLGLFIASEIAKAHDGRIDVHSDEKETRFTFTMPLSEAEQPAGQ